MTDSLTQAAADRAIRLGISAYYIRERATMYRLYGNNTLADRSENIAALVEAAERNAS